MNWQEHIHTSPSIAAGRPIFIGTRLRVDFVLGLLAQGWSEADIFENYPGLPAEFQQAACSFASEMIRETTLYAIPGNASR